MSDYAIETRDLHKVLGGRAVVDGLNLAVPKGSVFGFLGPNGAGKTTTIRMLLGLAGATSGRVVVLGSDIPERAAHVFPDVGAMVDGPAYYPFLTGRQNLERIDSLGASHTRADVDGALARVGLTNAADKRFSNYSLGMRQRLGLAVALMRPRKLLILDEPTNGLDPQGMREVRALIRQVNAEGTTVFLSSHLLSEVQQLCTDAAVLSAGKLVAQGPIADLLQAKRRVLRLHTPDVEVARDVLQSLGGVVNVDASAVGAVDVELESALPEDVVAVLVYANVRVQQMTEVGEDLEDAFVALTGEGFDVAQ